MSCWSSSSGPNEWRRFSKCPAFRDGNGRRAALLTVPPAAAKG